MQAPNLFQFAPSELSQDAFFLWLLTFADSKFISTKFDTLNQVAREMLLAMVRKHRPNFDMEFKDIQLKKQYKFQENYEEKKKSRLIDILITVNEQSKLENNTDECLKIIIESKTNSKEHGNQLNSYAKHAIEQGWNFIGIYLKTGNEAKFYLNQISDKTSDLGIKFEVFNRQDILNILKKYSNIKNDIYQSYLQYLQEIENKSKTYLNLPIKDWQGYSWQGFFADLEKEFNDFEWKYVDNPNGGFWAGDLIVRQWQEHQVVFAIHQHKLVFGIFIDDEDMRSQKRNEFSKYLLEKSETSSINLQTPKRFGHGKFMKVAEVEQQHWLGNNDETVDMEKVIENIEVYKEFFEKITDNCKSS
ncbi:Uncharacterised protein [Moraxella lacunata]|uniref:Uncharacterized protein n=1 Tax=Moraxella lacunata TaxID=477 RepID=A0A378T601_MORLA|nr:PD-(D/E)XK nuclease family protein [Moraxella lacunata]STZ56252.1 Uncharacterised protein [Moraxella lacunata]